MEISLFLGKYAHYEASSGAGQFGGEKPLYAGCFGSEAELEKLQPEVGCAETIGAGPGMGTLVGDCGGRGVERDGGLGFCGRRAACKD